MLRGEGESNSHELDNENTEVLFCRDRTEFVKNIRLAFPNNPLLIRAAADGKDERVIEMLKTISERSTSRNEELYWGGNKGAHTESDMALVAIDDLEHLIVQESQQKN